MEMKPSKPADTLRLICKIKRFPKVLRQGHRDRQGDAKIQFI